MTNKELNKKITDIINRYHAGIFVGLTEDKDGQNAFCTTTGDFKDIMLAITSIVLDSDASMVSLHIKNLLFQTVLNIMLSKTEYAEDFFDQMELISDSEETDEEKGACRIIKMHTK